MATKMLSHNVTSRALRRFGFCQTVRGAIIIGLLIGLVMGGQGPVYSTAYPTTASRHAFVTTLEAAPALGFMAGETANAAQPASYSIYKSITLTTMVTAIWGLLVATRLLRGQEEDGRLEVILSGALTKRRASTQLLLGFGQSMVLSYLLALFGIAALGRLPHVNLSLAHAALLTVGVYLPGLVFLSLGVVTSQLARTRGRAVLYGLLPLLMLFGVRGVANSNATLNWLKHLSPFGWVDLLNPVLSPHGIWVVPAVGMALLLFSLGLFLAGKRDLGASLWHESAAARSRFFMLTSPLALTCRQHTFTFLAWAVGTLAFTGLFTSLARLSADVLKNASGAQAAIAKLGNSAGTITVAFISIGTLLTAMILLVMIILMVARIRRDEAKGHLDTVLVQPVARHSWLLGRAALIITSAALIAVASVILSWLIAHYIEHITAVQLLPALRNTLSLIGVLLFVLGVGIALYGFFPRLAVAGMTIVVGWSYAIDTISSVIKVTPIITDSSLFHYLVLSPAASPNWAAIMWLSGLGIGLVTLGLFAFSRRDVLSE